MKKDLVDIELLDIASAINFLISQSKSPNVHEVVLKVIADRTLELSNYIKMDKFK